MPPLSDSRSGVRLGTEGGVFATTHWSVVLSAADTESPAAAEALEKLCQTYWQPLYAFIRRAGHSPPDAQDLTQGFLAHLLEKGALQKLSPDKGRFRNFLLAALKYFLAKEREKHQTQRRGGNVTIISLDAALAERQYALEPADDNNPEQVFERRWALTLVDNVLTKLEAELTQAGKADRWRELKMCLLGEGASLSYAEIASRLGVTPSAIKMAVLRLRQRFGELLRYEIAGTVSSEEEVEEELRHLLSVIS